MDKATLTNLAMLARKLPGVASVAVRHDGNGTHIWFRCDSLRSLAMVSDLAAGANVLVHVIPPQPTADGVDLDSLAFQITISDDVDGGCPSAAQILGIFMARYLKRAGLLAPEIADELQREWNAVVM